MSFGLTNSFSQVAANVVSAQPSGQTMTQVISPNLNTSCLVDVSMNVSVGAAAQAKAGIVAGAENGARTLAAGVDNIMKVKAEIAECAKANGVGAQDAFPDMKMAPDSVAQLAGGVVAPALASAMGSGTAAQLASGALKGSSGASLASDISTGLKGKPTGEIKAAIRETAIANSPDKHTGPSGALIQDANATPQLEKPLSCDYEALLAADDGALEKIMACDGTNLEHFPELEAIQANLAACEVKIGSLTVLESLGAGSVDAMDTHSLAAQAANIDAGPAVSQDWGIIGPLASQLGNHKTGPAANAPTAPSFENGETASSDQNLEAEMAEMLRRAAAPAPIGIPA